MRKSSPTCDVLEDASWLSSNQTPPDEAFKVFRLPQDMAMLEGRSSSELIQDGVKHLGRFNTIFAQLMHQSGSKVDKLRADLLKSQSELADAVKDAQLWEKKAHILEGKLHDTKNRLRNAEGRENSLKAEMESLKMERTYLKLQLEDAQHQRDVAYSLRRGDQGLSVEFRAEEVLGCS